MFSIDLLFDRFLSAISPSPQVHDDNNAAPPGLVVSHMISRALSTRSRTRSADPAPSASPPSASPNPDPLDSIRELRESPGTARRRVLECSRSLESGVTSGVRDDPSPARRFSEAGFLGTSTEQDEAEMKMQKLSAPEEAEVSS